MTKELIDRFKAAEKATREGAEAMKRVQNDEAARKERVMVTEYETMSRVLTNIVVPVLESAKQAMGHSEVKVEYSGPADYENRSGFYPKVDFTVGSQQCRIVVANAATEVSIPGKLHGDTWIDLAPRMDIRSPGHITVAKIAELVETLLKVERGLVPRPTHS